MGESGSGDGGYWMFSKVSLTIGVCGKASNAVFGEILSLGLSRSWPSHMTTVGLRSPERAEYRLPRELGRDSGGARRVVATVVEDGLATGALRRRDDGSSRPWLPEPCHLEPEATESVVADRTDFERGKGEGGDKVVGEGKNSEALESSR